MFSFFKRKPKPIVVFLSGAVHHLMPGDGIEATAADRQKLVVVRPIELGDANAIEIILHERPKPPRFKR